MSAPLTQSTIATITSAGKRQKMYRARTPATMRVLPVTVCVAAFTLIGWFGATQRAEAQGSTPPPTEEGGMEMPHAFFTHEGLPEGVGSYSLRVAALSTHLTGQNQGDFAFHLEMGLTKLIGLHIRNDRFLNSDKTEAMFQFAAITNKSGTNGFAPIIEFQFPTHSGASGITTETGFTTKFTGARYAFNQVLHYSPRENAADGSAGLVVKISDKVFPVVELLGEGGRNMPTVFNVLAGLKFRVRPWITVGIALMLPLTSARDFASEGVFEPEFVWGKAR